VTISIELSKVLAEAAHSLNLGRKMRGNPKVLISVP
jgi:hypothetical protein